MSRQNQYDDPEFFARYSQMARSAGGLAAACEWPAFRALLPNLSGRRVLDLGCGFGWHCRYAREQGARSVLGLDLSANMLARARAATHDPAVEYRLQAIEDIDLPPDSFDLVVSSLALHYIEHIDVICQCVRRCLVPGGAFIFSVEHPVFTALESQDWHYGQDGQPLHWPVDRYSDEGVRHTRWLIDGVIKYHRTLATWINTLIDSGFAIAHIVEPVPTPEVLATKLEWADERRRPMFLLISSSRS